ncbi:MAG: ribbon-helix-helix protein, CopG family [Candidatus Nanohaloarchaea archaeon]
MASLTIKLPEEQKSEIETIAGEKNYNSVSEYVREALRDKVEEDLLLRPEVAEKLRERVEEVRSGEADLESHEDVLEELGLE